MNIQTALKKYTSVLKAFNSSISSLKTIECKRKKKKKSFYLNQKYDEEVEIGDSPELLKHIFGDEVPKRVLKTQGALVKQCIEFQFLYPSRRDS